MRGNIMVKMREIIEKVKEVIEEIMWIYGLTYQTRYEDNWDFIMDRVKINLKAKLEDLEKVVGKKLERCWFTYELALYGSQCKSDFALRVELGVLVSNVLKDVYEDIIIEK